MNLNDLPIVSLVKTLHGMPGIPVSTDQPASNQNPPNPVPATGQTPGIMNPETEEDLEDAYEAELMLYEFNLFDDATDEL